MQRKDKTKKKLNTDLYLFILSPILLLSGIILFITLFVFELRWINYDFLMHIHAFSAIPVYYLFIRHIVDHASWYKKHWLQFSRALYQTWLLSLSFILTSLTGFIIFFFSGENSSLSLMLIHSLVGIIASYFTISHILKYFDILTKWVKHRFIH